MYITKKNGRVVVFDNEKIEKSILRANADAGDGAISAAESKLLAEKVFELVTQENEIITTADVTKAVCRLLREKGHEPTAGAYLSYAANKK